MDVMRPNQHVFVGRTDELTTIGQLAADAVAGRPRVALIEGGAGAGKSALVRALNEPLRDFTPVRIEAADGAAEMPMWMLGQVLPKPSSTPFAAGLELLELLAEHQARGPVAVVVEDLHWGDAASRQAILTAMQRLQEGDRVLGVVTVRGDVGAFDDGWSRFSDDAQRCHRVPVGPLSVDDVADLASRLGVDISTRAARALHAHTSGHPLHVRTLLHELDAEQLNTNGPLPAPRSLAATTAARIASLPVDAQAVVAALAVLGGSATLEQIAALSGATIDKTIVDTATATGIVEDPDGSGRSLKFAHPLHRTAIYDDLSPTRRRSLHLMAAEHAADPIAALSHRADAADSVDDVLAEELEAAATTAGDPAVAGRLLTAAADLSGDPSEASRRVLRAADVFASAGDMPSAQRLEPRIEACPAGAERDLVMGWLAWQRGDGVGAERWFRLAATGPADDESARTVAWLQLGSVLALQLKGAEAIAAAESALASGDLGEPQRERALVTMARGIAQAHGGVRALEMLGEHFPDPWHDVERIDPHRVRARGVIHSTAGQPVESIRWLDATIGSDRRGEIISYLAQVHRVRAEGHHRVGSWDQALFDARRAIELAVDLDQMWALPHAHAVAARVESGQGNAESAATHLARSIAVSALTTSFEAVILAATGHAARAHASDNRSAVAAALEPVFADGGAHLPYSDTLQYWPMYVDALIDSGSLDEAAEHSAALQSAAAARRLDMRMQLTALSGRIAAAGGRAGDAADAFAEAETMATPNTDMLDHAMLLHRHGRLLRSTGHRQLALERFERCRELLAGAHAEPYLQRLDADLEEVGQAAAPRRRSRYELTDRERDVAALVARGLTNKEVAAELYVSTKAVEYHLGNIFAKLAITNRRELGAALAPT
jgi:DNA-binding CsgD family transcriptional regulator